MIVDDSLNNTLTVEESHDCVVSSEKKGQDLLQVSHVHIESYSFEIL